nr:AT1G04950 [Arabidopsis thaliana]
MSIVPKETVEVIAQSIGITNLLPEAALMLAPDVEYRVREIMQEAIKCMRHSKRTTLTASDVDGALNLRNVEPIYGFASGGPFRFRKAIGHRDLFYTDDREVDFKDVIEAPLPKAPLDTEIVCHWLAIEGVQPAIPENAPLEVIRAPAETKIHEQKDGPLIDVRLPVKHVLSRELQLYFQKIAELAMSKSNPPLYKEALVSLASDSGLHPLVPYFTNFIADEVSNGLNDFRLLFNLMHIVRSLLQNPHIHIEPYLHQLMPSVVTCLVSRKLGNRFADNHWELRDFAANLVSLICKRYGTVYITLQSRLTRTLVNALLDPKKALTQHYGAIQGLAALGHTVVRLLILSNLEPYLSLLEPELNAEKQKNQMKIYEAWRVYGALLRVAGLCIHGRLKIFPPLPSPSPSFLHKGKGKGKIISTDPHKRKLSVDSSENQSPQKRLITMDGPDGVHSQDQSGSAPMQVDNPVENDNPPQNSVQPSSSEQASDANESESRNGKVKESGRSRAITMKAILDQIWKDDLDSGRLLVKLHELYGDRILPFIPSTEMSVFL